MTSSLLLTLTFADHRDLFSNSLDNGCDSVCDGRYDAGLVTRGRYTRGSCALCSRKVRYLDGTLDIIYCDRCLPEIFPFNAIVNDREFREALNGFRIEQRHLDKAAGLRFNPLDGLIKDTLVDLERTLGNCSYYDEEKYCKMRQDFSKKNGELLSLLCLNINGLPRKLEDFELLQETLRSKFDILGFTETHFNEVSEKLANLGGYNLVSNCRKNKRWGGVAIYLR